MFLQPSYFDLLIVSKTISLICLQVNRWKHLPRRTTYINCIFVRTIIYSIKVKCRWQDKWNHKYAKLRNYDLIVCKFLLYLSYYFPYSYISDAFVHCYCWCFPCIFHSFTLSSWLSSAATAHCSLNQLLAYENKQQLHNS